MRMRWRLCVYLLLAAACSSKSLRREPASIVQTDVADAYHTKHGDFVVEGDQKAMLGRDIWIKATAGDARFFAYGFPQRIAGKSINWPDMLLAEKKAVSVRRIRTHQ